jgi:hypothetical protein
MNINRKKNKTYPRTQEAKVGLRVWGQAGWHISQNIKPVYIRQ